MLIALDLPRTVSFLLMDKDLSEATKFASLRATKAVAQVIETKDFWVLMEVSIHMAIN